MPARELRFEPLPQRLARLVGVGVCFPFRFSSKGRSRAIDIKGGTEKINQSIHQILATRPGERIMLPEFGSKLYDLIFEPEDEILYDQLYYWTVTAISRWEPRIDILNVSVFTSDAMREQFFGGFSEPDKNTIGIQIEYEVRDTHQTGSYIYPFQTGGMPHNATLTRG